MSVFNVLNGTKSVWVETDTDHFWSIAVPVASFVGLIANIICFAVFNSSEFSDKKKLKENMFAYLKIESLFIIINLFIQIFRPLSRSFPVSLLSKVYDVYALWTLAGVLEMSALLSHLMSTIDFLMIITNNGDKFEWVHRISKYLKALCIFVLSFASFAYLIFCFEINGYEIEVNNGSETEWIYAIEDTPFKTTSTKTTIEIIAYLSRDGLINLILLCLNMLIYFNVRKSLDKKKSFIHSKTPNGNKSHGKIKSANTKAILMVILTCLNNVFGRTPILIVFVLRNFYNLLVLNTTVIKLACLAVYISYILNFFIYFLSNSRFRKIFKRHFITVCVACAWIEKIRKLRN
jgi:hypothetical protein